MTRPGIASIVSGIAASSAAFFVVSRWQLLGTVAGAALISAVYTLVSHYSSESLDRGGRWLWRHVRRRPEGGTGGTAAEQDSLEDASREEASADDRAAAASVSGRPRTVVGARTGSKMQWSLGAFALLAFGFSIYALSASGTIEKTIVEQRVIEKTVTVTSEVVREVVTEVAQAPVGGSAFAVAPAAAVKDEQATAPTTDTTSGSEDAAARPVSTVVTTVEDDAEEQDTTSSTQGAATSSTSAPVVTTGITEQAPPDVP